MNINIDITKFEKDIEKAGKNINDVLNSSVKKIAVDTESNLKQITPVDTGRARSGWNTVEVNKGYKISNNVPYINKLNNGYSKKAPANFVQISIKRAVESFKRFFK